MDLSDKPIEEWWDRLTGEQRTLLKQAVQTYPADPSVLTVLINTGCPIPNGWTVTSWSSVPDSQALTLHGRLEKFIESKLDVEN